MTRLAILILLIPTMALAGDGDGKYWVTGHWRRDSTRSKISKLRPPAPPPWVAKSREQVIVKMMAW